MTVDKARRDVDLVRCYFVLCNYILGHTVNTSTVWGGVWGVIIPPVCAVLSNERTEKWSTCSSKKPHHIIEQLLVAR